MKYIKTFENNILYDKFINYIDKYAILENSLSVEDEKYEPYVSKYKLVKINDITKSIWTTNEIHYYLQYTFMHFIYKGYKVQRNSFFGSTVLEQVKIFNIYDDLKEAKKDWILLQDTQTYNL